MATQREKDLELQLAQLHAREAERDRHQNKLQLAKIGVLSTVIAALAGSPGWVAFAQREPPPAPEVTKIEAAAIDAKLSRVESKIDKVAEGVTSVKVDQARLEGRVDGVERWASRKGFDPERSPIR